MEREREGRGRVKRRMWGKEIMEMIKNRRRRKTKKIEIW